MRRNWLRAAVFQIHLWGGLGLGVYAFLIGLTGSLLVFREELVERIAPEPRVAASMETADLDKIHAGIQAHYPDWHVFSVESPEQPGRPWSSYLLRPDGGRLVFADSHGKVVGERNLSGTWFELVERFHSNLMLPRGRLINGIAGLLVVVLAVTGAVLWWPGQGEWANAFRVVRRANWKGINYDLHRVGGVLTSAFVVLFCITGAYFTWPAVYRMAVGSILPVTPRPASARIENRDRVARLPINALVRAAQEQVPDGVLVRILLSQSATQPVHVVFRHGDGHETSRTSEMAVNPYTAAITSAEMYANRGTGDHVISLLGPLHTGHFGGLPVKIVWALAGLAMPALFVTGFLMWWNRVLRRALS